MPKQRVKLKMPATVLLTALSLPLAITVQPRTSPTTPIQDQATLRGTVQTAFGQTVEPVTGFKPFFLTGDFNGDAALDVVIVVRLNRGRSALAKDVKASNPFKYGPVAANSPTLAFAIIHGSKAGWHISPPVGKFILFGQSPILILQQQRAGEVDAAKDLMSLKRKRRRGDVWPPAAAPGDGILLETEATDSILYWDGKTYRWEESANGE